MSDRIKARVFGGIPTHDVEAVREKAADIKAILDDPSISDAIKRLRVRVTGAVAANQAAMDAAGRRLPIDADTVGPVDLAAMQPKRRPGQPLGSLDQAEVLRRFQWLILSKLKRYGLGGDPDAHQAAALGLLEALRAYRREADASVGTFAGMYFYIDTALKAYLDVKTDEPPGAVYLDHAAGSSCPVAFEGGDDPKPQHDRLAGRMLWPDALVHAFEALLDAAGRLMPGRAGRLDPALQLWLVNVSHRPQRLMRPHVAARQDLWLRFHAHRTNIPTRPAGEPDFGHRRILEEIRLWPLMDGCEQTVHGVRGLTVNLEDDGALVGDRAYVEPPVRPKLWKHRHGIPIPFPTPKPNPLAVWPSEKPSAVAAGQISFRIDGPFCGWDAPHDWPDQVGAKWSAGGIGSDEICYDAGLTRTGEPDRPALYPPWRYREPFIAPNAVDDWTDFAWNAAVALDLKPPFGLDKRDTGGTYAAGLAPWDLNYDPARIAA